ncbi:Gfo/Idh/MocA family protein [Enterococcus sp. LJL120]
MKKIRYGIVSTATIVTRFVEGINQSEAGEVIAIAGRDLMKAKALADELAIPHYYGSYQELYQDEQVDLVYIANYNGGHYQCIKAALEQNKPVLCEKPMCLTKAQSEEVFQLAASKNLFLMEAQKAVFLPAQVQARQLIQAGALGEIQWVNIISSHTGAKRGEWFKEVQKGGGILRGAGTYALEFLLTAFGGPLENYAGNCSMEPPTSDDSWVINLALPKQILASLLITKDIHDQSRIEIYGTKGKITIPNFWKTNRLISEIAGETKEYLFEMQSEFVYEINHVNQCLQAGQLTSPLMTPAVTIAAIQVIDDLYRRVGVDV